MAELLVDFNKDFEGLINPLFKLLYYRYEEKENADKEDLMMI